MTTIAIALSYIKHKRKYTIQRENMLNLVVTMQQYEDLYTSANNSNSVGPNDTMHYPMHIDNQNKMVFELINLIKLCYKLNFNWRALTTENEV